MKVFQKIRFLLLASSIFHCSLMVIAQNEFVSVVDFDESLKSSDLRSLERDFDLLKILLLDHSKKELLFKYDPDFEGLFSEYSESMVIDKKTLGFVTDFRDIKAVFNEPERIYSCVFVDYIGLEGNFKIDQPIYINENKAIVEILSPTTSDLFYLRIYDGIVQINWLGGTIE